MRGGCPLTGDEPAGDELAGDELALFRLRAAAGAEADPRAPAVRAFLAATVAHPVLGFDLAGSVRVTFDWSAGSHASAWTPQRLSAHLAAVGARVGIGRYLEDRDVYIVEAFAPSAGSAERRTVHLGVDLFVPPGAGVFAPLDGVVHAAHDNAAPLDYGPVVILRHSTADGVGFFTLYGHLSRTALERLVPGTSVRAGERFAAVGTTGENGGWAPHLHLQLLTSLCGLGVDVPGVAARGDLAVWASLSPDPNLLLRLPEGVAAGTTAPGVRGPGGSQPHESWPGTS